MNDKNEESSVYQPNMKAKVPISVLAKKLPRVLSFNVNGFRLYNTVIKNNAKK